MKKNTMVPPGKANEHATMPVQPIGHSLEALAALPTWEWPDDAIDRITAGLKSDEITEQCLAARLAGFVPDDRLAVLLLECLAESDDDDVRAEAAIALGPILEESRMVEFSDGDMPTEISASRVQQIQGALRRAYHDANAPTLVRRRALEAAVRAPTDWHIGAARAAFRSGDIAWRITGLFAMGYLDGFEAIILESLDDPSNDVVREAVTAAGRHALEAAGTKVLAMVEQTERGPDVQRAAIEALAQLRPEGTADALNRIIEHSAEPLASAANVALDETLMWKDIEAMEDL